MIGLGLLGCAKAPSAPPFPLTWEAKGVHELTARVRRVEHLAHHTANYELVIDTAEIEVGGTRAPAPVRVQLTPSGVKAGLTLQPLIVGGLENFGQSIDLAAVDATGNESARLRVYTEATGTPRVMDLRPFGR